jgi:hypothetical protein
MADVPRPNGDPLYDGDPVVEVNHCHGPGQGHPCAPGAGAAEKPKPLSKSAQRAAKSRAADQAVLDYIDERGRKVVRVGELYGRPFGEREYQRMERLVKQGVLERVPEPPGGRPGSPIKSRAPYMNNSDVGYHSEIVYRRKQAKNA